MSITIVTVTYNSSKLITNFFESIRKQKYPLEKLNIVIVDNNSPDIKFLKPIIEKYKKVLPIKTIYRTKNYGFASSCNLGARNALDNILFLNPDTELSKRSLLILENHLTDNNANIIGGRAQNAETAMLHRTVYNRVTLWMMLFEFSNLGKIFAIDSNFYIDQQKISNDLEVGGVGGGYMLIAKKAFIELKGFDEKFFMYLEDVDICMRASALNHKVMYCPHSQISHVGGASSSNKHRISHSSWYNSREYYARKYFIFPISTFLIVMYKIERLLLMLREIIAR